MERSADRRALLAIEVHRQHILDKIEACGCISPPDQEALPRLLDGKISELTNSLAEFELLENHLEEDQTTDDLYRQAAAFLERHKKSDVVQPKRQETVPGQEMEMAKEEEESDGIRRVTEEELKEVPGYMRNRLLAREVNEVIDKISELLLRKHSLLLQPMQRLGPKEKDLVIRWREQGSDSSTISILETELREAMPDKTKKNVRSVLPCLRHLRRIREDRVKGASRIVPIDFRITSVPSCRR